MIVELFEKPLGAMKAFTIVTFTVAVELEAVLALLVLNLIMLLF